MAALLGVSILFSPLILRFLEHVLLRPVPALASWLTSLFGVLVFIGFLLVMHRTLPGRRMKGSRLWPGVMVTTVLWVAFASAFSIYLSFTPTYTVTYGTLAGVIITLMFFYLTGATIIYGAEVNAALNQLGLAERGSDEGLMAVGLKKRRRIQLVAIAAVLLAAATAIVGYAMRDGIEFFRSPSQLAAEPAAPGERFRLGGLVAEGTVAREGGEVRFEVTDGGAARPGRLRRHPPRPLPRGPGRHRHRPARERHLRRQRDPRQARRAVHAEGGRRRAEGAGHVPPRAGRGARELSAGCAQALRECRVNPLI